MHANQLTAVVLAMIGTMGFQAPPQSPQLEPTTKATPPVGSLNWYMSRPWRHVGSPVTDQQFEQDKAKCAVTANMAPVGQGSPEIKYLVVWISCMKAAGYEPVP